MKLPFACIPKPSTAKSGSHIVIVLSLCVDGYVIGSSLSTKVSPGWYAVGTFSVVRVNVTALVGLLVPGGR